MVVVVEEGEKMEVIILSNNCKVLSTTDLTPWAAQPRNEQLPAGQPGAREREHDSSSLLKKKKRLNNWVGVNPKIHVFQSLQMTVLK